MATVTIYATSGGYVSHTDTVYATADSASATTKVANTTSAFIESGNFFSTLYEIRQAFQGFDTSVLVNPSTTGATVNIYCQQEADAAGGPWDWKLWENNWTGTLSTTDFTLSSGLGSLNTLDTKSFADTFTTGYFSFSVSGHSQLTGTDTFMGMFLGAANQGTAPVDGVSEQALRPISFNETGTTQDPYLTITDTGLDTETLFPDSIALNRFDAGTITDIDEGVDSADANWLTVTDPNTNNNPDARVTFPTPTGNPVGTQTFRAWVRKNASGGGDPEWRIGLYDTNTVIDLIIASGTVTSATGEIVTATWDASQLITADGSLVEAAVTFINAGGGPNKRTGELGAVEWQVQYEIGVVTRYFFIT